MSFDQNLIYNYASFVTTLLFVTAAGVTIFRRLKLRWPVNVNCWFCNNNTKIYHSERVWWRCPSCEQYNGFTKDGDYAYDIPEQSKHRPKVFAKLCTKDEKSNVQNAVGNLCERCNRNEELKLLEIQCFEPKGLFGGGLNEFKQSLETKYPLCDDCKILVQNVLRRQSLWLTRYKMLVFKQKSVNAIINNVKKLDTMVRIFLTILGASMVCYPGNRLLPFIGVFFQSSAFAMNSANKTSDAVSTLLWICIILIEPLNKINLFEIYQTNEWLSLEIITERHFIIILTVIIGFTNLTSRYKNTRSFKATFKKLESPNATKNSSTILNDSFDNVGTSVIESQNYSHFPLTVNNTENTMRQTSIHKTRKCKDGRTVSPKKFTKDRFRDYAESGGRHVLKFDDNSEQYSLNDSLSTLKTLSLGDTRAGQKTRIPSIFKSRVYGSTSPDLFQRASGKTSRKFVLAPPKLKSFAQTSWVAGGYWQVDVDTPSLSRSSSQSSGFGSAGSNFGPSREPSIGKEIDKCSVVSDNPPFSPPSRPNSVNSVNSCCQHVTNFQLPRFDNSPCNNSLRILPSSSYSQNSHFTPVHPDRGCYEHCLSLHNSLINSSPIQQSQVPNIPTFFNSHAWLPILLCGSLVFNIAVFCTVIMR